METGEIVAIFPRNWYCPTPSCNKVTQSTSLKNCLLTFKFPISFFPLLLSNSRENRTKLNKILNLSQRLEWNTISKMWKLHLIFLSTLASRDQSKWKANNNEHGERYIVLIRIESGFTLKRIRDMTKTYSPIRMFVLKVVNNEKKTRHEMVDRIVEQIVVMITRVCKESVSSSELTAVNCLICLFI